ncbi:MAG TPA: DUF983 domain-containing protein [Longimicrobiales bacterium]
MRRTTSPAAILGRALARRCPHCGCRQVFRSWLHHREACPSCGLRLDRGEPDFFVGAYTINLIAAELLVVVGGLLVLRLSWPAVPWDALMWGLAGLMVAVPVVLYPYSRQLWLATDLLFRPAESDDFLPLVTDETSCAN